MHILQLYCTHIYHVNIFYAITRKFRLFAYLQGHAAMQWAMTAHVLPVNTSNTKYEEISTSKCVGKRVHSHTHTYTQTYILYYVVNALVYFRFDGCPMCTCENYMRMHDYANTTTQMRISMTLRQLVASELSCTNDKYLLILYLLSRRGKRIAGDQQYYVMCWLVLILE